MNNPLISAQPAPTAVLCLLLQCSVVAPGAAVEPQAPATMTLPCPADAARVVVSTSGIITLNSHIVAVSDIAGALRALKPAPTSVCYYRENPAAAEPPASAFAALDALASLRLPIAMFVDSAFTQRLIIR